MKNSYSNRVHARIVGRIIELEMDIEKLTETMLDSPGASELKGLYSIRESMKAQVINNKKLYYKIFGKEY